MYGWSCGSFDRKVGNSLINLKSSFLQIVKMMAFFDFQNDYFREFMVPSEIVRCIPSRLRPNKIDKILWLYYDFSHICRRSIGKTELEVIKG